MDEKVFAEVAAVLRRWNPLGEMADTVPDLNGYEIEASDIVCTVECGFFGNRVEIIVRDVLNQAFGLSLTTKDCVGPAREITSILRKEGGFV
jgi:hypothetical protein